MGTGTMELKADATVDVQVSLTATAADKIRASAAGALRLGGTLAVSGVDRVDADSWADVTRTIVDKEVGGTIGWYDQDAQVMVGHEFEAVVPVPGDDASSHVGQGAFLREVDYKTTGAAPADTESVELKLFIALGGDSDGDGTVWLSDWAALRANFGNTGIGKTWTDGNFDPWADDKVWLSDWAQLRANFANADYTADGAAAVPEPGTLVMLLSGMAGLVLLARRRCSRAL
ncbi:MAG: PEP-CTERM sorting domain-containing protein [Candidatus Nealsonbacteria bacterium]|nr:PEP-CTERM sorting domain-containing protein [Candidatus Nealsonbacteria bacterium]